MSNRDFWKRHASDPEAPVRKAIADDTLRAIKRGSFDLNGTTHPLAAGIESMNRRTKYYAPDSLLSGWAQKPQLLDGATTAQPETAISFYEISTLDGCRYLSNLLAGTDNTRIGVLNFASAKNPGGGFLQGTQAQEESIARSSTLYPSLMTPIAQQFYDLHKADLKRGFYTHAMIYSPGVVVFRDDEGEYTTPVEIDVLTSAAVNAGHVRKNLGWKVEDDELESRIERQMKERMGRLLFLFERQGVKNLVLGSFGTGVFKNDRETVATIWADLLAVPGARFKDTFDNVVFAILGKGTFDAIQTTFISHSENPEPAP